MMEMVYNTTVHDNDEFEEAQIVGQQELERQPEVVKVTPFEYFANKRDGSIEYRAYAHTQGFRAYIGVIMVAAE